MPRRLRTMVIRFMDGDALEVTGTSDTLKGDGNVLSVYTDQGDGYLRDVRNFPIHNIREYHWEER